MSSACHTSQTDGCCGGMGSSSDDAAFRRILWAALAINAGMFLVEAGAGLGAGSASLLADALDFLGDAGNYVISLVVVGMSLRRRALAATVKGATMGLFGLWVIAFTAWNVAHDSLPHAATMGVVGFAALIANGTVFGLLWAHRKGDSNRRSVWVCSRNDLLANMAVIIAALGVFGTGTRWPDLIVAAIIASLALQGAWQVLRHAARDRARADDEPEALPRHA